MKEKTIKEMLERGMSESELIEILKGQIKDAKDEIAAEKAKAKAEKKNIQKVKKTREAALRAGYEHMVALGLVDDCFTDEDFHEMCEELEEAEQHMMSYSGLMNSLLKCKHAKDTSKDRDMDMDADSIIERFLRSLD